jgi:uncharacterized protein DUF4153
MALSRDMQALRHRLVLSGLGAIAALALWALADNWEDPALSPPLYLAVFTFVATYFSVALALAGPVRVDKALAGALLIAVPVTALVSLAGLRQVVATDLLDEAVMLSVIAVLVFCSIPFLLVRLETPDKWRNYAALFDATWSMVVRYSAAYIFVGVFWLVTFLSNALLELVGVDIIDRLLQTDWAPFALSGAVLGLGLAVVYELREKLSPFLILRLLRLLVPVVLVVLVIFLAAIPFRGLGELFGEFSSAATLMGAAIVAIILISTALDRDDTMAVHTSGLSIATRALAVLVAPLAALAAWAVLERILQYGWTPDRLLAMAAASFVLAYGVGYAGAVLRGQGWGARVRNVNVAMAMAIIGVAALWLTPVLDPFRISANNQVARFEAGRSDLDQLPVWALQNDWGKAGQKGLARLEGKPGQDELATRIEAVRNQASKYQFQRALDAAETSQIAQDLARLMPVRPIGASMPEAAFDNLESYRTTRWLQGCNRPLPDGRPGCVLIRGVFSPTLQEGAQAMVLFLDDQGRTRANHLLIPDSGDVRVNEVIDPVAVYWNFLPGDAVARALDGDFEIRPSGANALFIGGAVLVPSD